MRINSPMMTADDTTTADGCPSVSSCSQNMMGKKNGSNGGGEKEVIHSGHFMVSDFEAEAQDDEENVLLEIPGDIAVMCDSGGVQGDVSSPGGGDPGVITYAKRSSASKFGIETFSIDSSLTKLFNAMSIAYRHKITSPKWNRFKGLKLRWKDKIRLNNVIWRCWHMQFIRKKRMTVCQFALDVDMHNKPEAIVLEGKYWKRQLEAVTAEYKKWRIYYKNKISGSSPADSDASLFDLEGMDFSKPYSGLQMSLEDGEFSEFMDFTDVLFSSLVSPPQAFAFPNPREIARGTGNSDFIQPGLIQLQPNLDDFMDIVEPLQEMLAGRGLPTVPEEDFLPEVGQTPELPPPSTSASPVQHPSPVPLHYTARVTANPFLVEAVPSPTAHDNINNNHTNSNNSPSTHHVPTTAPSAVVAAPLAHPQTHHHQQSHHHHHHPHHSPVYRPQMPPLEQQQQQPQLVSLPTQSPPSSYHQTSLVRHQGLHNQQPQPTTIQLQQQQPPTPSPLQLSQQQPLTPPQLQPPLTPPHLHQQPHTPPQQQQQLKQQQGPSSPPHQLHHSPRAFIRSHSQHELGTQPQQQHQISHNDDTFVIPKSYPRRRSHSSGGSNSGLVGVSPSLAPQQQVVSSLAATSLSHLSPSINTVIATSLPRVVPAPPPVGSIAAGGGQAIISAPVIAPVQAATTPGGSALLAQLLTSGSCPVNCSTQSLSSHQLATISTSGLNNLSTNNSMTVDSCSNVKVSLMIPGVITGNSSASSNCSSSSRCSISSNSSSIKPGVSSVLVSPITLSAVTPSTLKTQSFSQMSPWSPCSPKAVLKQSPPHPEPTSPPMMNVPSPPNKAFRPKSDTERVQYKEHRRVCHINAEQKRRSNLKSNFDIMHQLIPSISQSPNAKISKAALLQKGSEYIQQLKTERQQLTDQAESLRGQIESLSLEISNAQAQLPATGAPMTHARHSKLKEMFTSYVRECTLSNWKFWIFSLITEPLLESYNNSVSTGSVDDLCRSSLAWLDQQCSLNVLRPLVSNSMRKLSTTTNVLADPDSLPEEIYRRVTKQEGEKFCSHR